MATPPIDIQTIAQRGGGLGGSASTQPPVDTQTVAQRGGGLGGSASTQKPVDTKTIAQRGGGLSTQGKPSAATKARGGKAKKPLSPVIDKRSVKQKLKDAQARRN